MEFVAGDGLDPPVRGPRALLELQLSPLDVELVAQVGLHWNDAFSCVGAGATLTAPRDGILYFAANDGGREDNAGEVSVTITGEIEPSPTLVASEIPGFDFTTVTADTLEIEGDHVILTLSTALVAADTDGAVASLAQFDAWYDLHEQLAGGVPYGGQRVR